MNLHQEPRFRKSEGETDSEFVRRIRVNGFWKFTDCKGNRWWPSDWGPRPDAVSSPVRGSIDSRPLPPPQMPYAD